MINKTPSKIVIEMKNIDHANKLAEALNLLPKDTGGDCTISVDGVSVLVGHDINVLSVNHVIEE